MKTLKTISRSHCLLLIAWVIIFLMPDLSFASEESTMKGTFEIFDLVLRFLSWVRVVPAMLAGELMSNDLVFGSKFNMEVYLWRIWTTMRGLANFVIGGLFLYYILMQIFKSISWTSVSEFMNKLLKLFLAAILVNASFFMMRALVDLSIVSTAAVSSLPNNVIASRRNTLKDKIPVVKKNCIENGASDQTSINCDKEETKTVWLDFILPQADTMAGPILFMWIGMMDLLSANAVPLSIKSRENLALASAAKVIMIILFTIPVFVLMIINMLRIALIRLWTIFSPFIILDLVLTGWKTAWDKLRYNGLGDILWLIFLPVVVVGAFAVGFILMLWLMSVIKWWEEYVARSVSNIQITDNPATLAVPHVVNIGVEWSLFQKTAFRTLWFFGEALMVFFCMAILRWVIRVSFWTNSAAKKWSEWMFGMAGNMVKAVPIVPFAWWMSISSIQQAWWVWWVVKKVSWIKQIEDASRAKSQARVTNMVKRFTWKDPYINDLSPDMMAQVRRVDSNKAKLDAIAAGVKSKSQVRYTWNIQDAFQSLNETDLKTNYFKSLSDTLSGDMTKIRATQWWQNFVKDVIEWNTLQKNADKYNLKASWTIWNTTFTPWS